jgi:hypothetical protein
MASKKASARDRADQFLAAIGTAGGPIGAPGLVAFGASDVARQIQSGNIDQYAAIRMMNGGPVVGDPNAPQPRMPQDLDAAYLKLNLPGSPLPRNGLLAPQFQKAAENIQNQLINQEQYAMMSMMPLTGQLPMLIQPPMPQKKGGR